MGVFDSFRSQSEAEQDGYEPLRIDADLASTLEGTFPRSAITVRPFKDNSGIEAMDEVLESLHSVETESPRLHRTTTNVSPAHAFEMRYAAPQPGDDRVVTLQYLAGDDRLDGTFERQLQTQYPDSQTDRTDPTFLTAREGQYIAGATLGLRRYCLYPIKNIDLPGFRSDPTGSVLEEMVGAQQEGVTDADVIVQIMFKPATRDWTQGVQDGHGCADVDDQNVTGAPGIRTLAYNLQQPTYERSRKLFTWETIEHPPSKVDKEIAKLLEHQQGEKGWHLCLRVFAVSDDPEMAVARASRTAGMFRNFYESNSEQTFVPQPLAGETLREHVRNGATREFEETGMVKAQREVAGLINVPKAEFVNTNKLRWSLARPGEGIPPKTPRFEYEQAGVDGASREEKQVAMLDVDDPNAPYWFGFGRKHGVEAGVTPETLNTHMFVGGGTGTGKTTFLTNLVSQIFQRGHGALVFDPKGMDADAFVREWPEDRSVEDFIFVDLSDDFEKQVRFNFLEVPTDAPPDSRAFATAVEALCDDLVAMMAQVGGEDNYWGALMNRVARTLIRGMAKSDRTCTLLDLACCCSAPENRKQFQEWMSEERIHFIEEAAQRIRMKEEEDLEPLAGRLDQWIQNDAVRNLISARESTVSLQDVVKNGKVLVVRNAPSSGETEKRLFATALTRRAWVAAREANDAPPFYVVCDEFDSIVTEESNIHKILSEARAFDFCLTLACQNPSNQLPEQVSHAIANQCETFITYNPGGKRDAKLIQAQHSPDVGWEDLVNLSKYRFYMRTHDSDDDLTHSYQVDAFPPAAEVRQAVTDDAGMSDEDLRWFKRRSVARHGTERPSAMEQKRDSHFYEIGQERLDRSALDTGDDADADAVRIDPTEPRIQRVCKAVYDEALQQRSDDGFVPANACADRMRAYLDVDIEYRSQLWDLVDAIPETRLESEVRDADVHLRCTSEGRTPILRTGVAANSGAQAHRELLKDTYDLLTTLGARIHLVEQTGADHPDGIGTLEDVQPAVDVDPSAPLRDRQEAHQRAFEQFVDDHPILAYLTDGRAFAIEAEASTGTTKPARTLFNLAQAVNQGRRCLFVCRPDVASSIWETLTDPPYSTMHGPTDGRRFFNHRDLLIDGELMLRPASGHQSVWTRDESGEYRLTDENGEELTRFPTAEAVFDDPSRYPATSATVDDSEKWAPVKRPFIPEYAFNEEPAFDEWQILVVPPDASDPTDLSLFVGGERLPFDDPDAFRDETAAELFDQATSNDTAADSTDDTADEFDDGDTSTDSDDENNDDISFRRF